MEETTIFRANEFGEELFNELIIFELKEIAIALTERGYDPITQIVGYIRSDDLTYITSFNDSREKISKYTKNELLAALVKGALTKK